MDTNHFDFDYWSSLNKNNRSLFEKERSKWIRELISNAHGSRRRLEGLQFKIDLEREKSKNPMAACVRLSNLMMAKFHSEFVTVINHGSKGLNKQSNNDAPQQKASETVSANTNVHYLFE